MSDEDLLQDDKDDSSEWQRHQILDPSDDDDEDAEEDDFIASVRNKNFNRPNRGNGMYGTA